MRNYAQKMKYCNFIGETTFVHFVGKELCFYRWLDWAEPRNLLQFSILESPLEWIGQGAEQCEIINCLINSEV